MINRKTFQKLAQDYFIQYFGHFYITHRWSGLTLLVGWQEGHPACKKTEWWGAGVVICLERGSDLHMAQLMPLPLTVSCFSKIQIGFTFLAPAHLGSPGKRAVKRVYVSVTYLLLRAFNALTLSVGRQEEHPACKNCVMTYWCGYLSGVRCKLFAYGQADATAFQNAIVSCFI